MNRIVFKKQDTAPKKCPICSHINSTAIASIQSKDAVFQTQNNEDQIIRCDSCYSVYFLDPRIVGYLNEDTSGFQKYTDHYLLVGCGIDLGVELLSDYTNTSGRLLEVGCGAGFSLSYWSSFKKMKGVGLEAAYYGSVGRALLQVDIRETYLKEESEPLGEFDVILSSEVIEHVEDPRSFLKALKNNLSRDGVLLLTTPAAEFIAAGQRTSVLLAALSQGFHYFLLSKQGMQHLLSEVGFNDVDIEIRNERMIVRAYLSHTGRKRRGQASLARSEYLDFLRFLLKNKNDIVREAALIRIFEELVNNGSLKEAGVALDGLLAILLKKYKLDLNLLICSVADSRKFSSLGDYLYTLPPYIGILLYYMGNYYSHSSKDIINKLICYGLAYQTLSAVYQSEPQFAQKTESLIELAGAAFFNAVLDSLSFFSGYAERRNVGISEELIDHGASAALVHKMSRLCSDVIARRSER